MADADDLSQSEQRMNHLEELFAHQERFVHQLNEVVTQLQARVEQIEQRQIAQEGRLRWIVENQSAGDDLPHEKPPHY